MEGWLLRTGDAVELRVTVEVVAGVVGMRALLLLCTIPLYMADKEEVQQRRGVVFCRLLGLRVVGKFDFT